LDEAAPVRRLWPPSARLGVWLTLVAVTAGVGLSGARPDLGQRLRDPAYLIETTALGVAGVIAAALALQATVPGREVRGPTQMLAFGIVTAAAVLWLRQPMHGQVTLTQFMATGIVCAARTVLLAAVPWCVLLIAVRRGAPLAPAKAGELVGAAAFLMAALLMRVECPLDERLHLLVWHALPVLGGTVMSAMVGLAWLRRWRSAAPR